MTEREVFSAAVALTDPARREAFLREACLGQDQLRRRVDALLRAHDDARAFLGTPAIEQVIGTTPPDISGTSPHAVNPADVTTQANSEVIADLHADRTLAYLSPTEKPGSLGRLGHYEIEAILGRGGFGTVLKAFDERLHRTVAIKMLAPELAATSPPRKRFLREARAAAAIRHQNVVAIYAVDDQPIPYFVMEFVPGETLQQLLDSHGPLDVADVLSIGQQIASGLAAAHAQGLVHRDIKPSNILLEGGRTGIVRISDFGLARTADDASLTQSGTVAGTPLFMSPEQAMGRSIDHRSDLFSLGSVLYVMVTGRPPFRAPSTVAVLRRVVEDPPRPIAEIIPECPAWLSAIIAKLLAKAPEDRIESAADVGDLLRQCLADLRADRPIRLPKGIPPAPTAIVAPIPAAPRETAPPPHRKRRYAPAIAAGLLCALIVSELVGTTQFVATMFGPSINHSFVERPTPTDETDVAAGHSGTPPQRPALPRNAAEVPPPEGLRDPAITLEPDRRAAEWVLSIGGAVCVNGQDVEIRSAGDLPNQAFDLTGIILDHNPQLRETGLSQLQGLAHVLKLRLDGSPLRDSTLAPLAELSSLRHLNLQATEITDQALVHLKDLPHLEGLALHHNPRMFDAGLRNLAGLSTLKWLDLRGTPVGDAGVAHLRQLPNLIEIVLEGTNISDHGLADLPTTPTLTSLQLQHSNVTDKGLETLAGRPALRWIVLIGTRVSAEGVRRLTAALPACNIEWDGGKIAGRPLIDHDRRAAEWVLSIGGEIKIRSRDTEQTLAAGQALPTEAFALTHVNLDDNPNATDAGLTCFVGCTNLRSLRLYHLGITDEGLAAFRECKQLEYLELEGTQAIGAGLAHFQECPNLAHLGLGFTNVGDAELAHFRNCSKLTSLGLRHTRVTDAGLAHLKDCTSLTEVNLEATGVTGEGLAHFANCSKLNGLSLCATQVGDPGIALLADCPSLRGLNLAATNVTADGIEQLSAALPRCKISWDGGVIEPAP